MPSPFPGMNPYLEDTTIWQTVHVLLIGDLTRLLNQVLPENFVARAEERMRILRPTKDTLPDVSVSRTITNGVPNTPGKSQPYLQPQTPAQGRVAVADIPLIIEIPPIQEREWYIEIVTSPKERNEVVTVLELLSPSNKAAGSKGRKEYLAKQERLLQEEQVNLIEIDLLRGGSYTLGVPKEKTLEQGKWDYGALVHRAARPWQYLFWHCTLREPLPRILVPLTEEVADVPLDLQEAVNRTYEGGAYGRTIDYRREPVPPLSEEDAKWADILLREQGLR